MSTSPLIDGNYRPRMAATLTVPLLGTRAQRINQEASTESLVLHVRPKSIRIERNDHNHADSASLVCDWTEAGIDPRLLDNAVAELYIDNADLNGDCEWTPDNCRFIGLTKDITASRDTENTAEVTIELLDYTTLFLTAKPFGSSGIPKYSMRLDEAWRTIVSQTPGADMLATRLVLEGLATFPELGKAVSDRFKKLSYVPTNADTDAWAVWQQCVGMCGLISYIQGDQCIITTATNYYSENDSPVLVWGRNLKEWGEVRHSEIASKGIGLTSFDPGTGTTVEAFWPPIGDTRVNKKSGKTAKKIQGQEKIRAREDRDWFTYAGVHNEDALTDCARRVWEERSRQELEGNVMTPDMLATTESGKSCDLLDLHAGDSVRVTVDPQERQLLAALPSVAAQTRFLTDRGYSEDLAALIIANVANLGDLESKFLTKTVTMECATSGDDGSFSLEIDYLNRIRIDGSAVA